MFKRLFPTLVQQAFHCVDKAAGTQICEVWCVPQGFYSQMRKDDKNHIGSIKMSATNYMVLRNTHTQKHFSPDFAIQGKLSRVGDTLVES